jgi:predicted dehydrogenase
VTRPLRVALVGAGLAAKSHALDIVTDETLELVGIVTATFESAASMAQMFGGHAYECLDAMLDDRSVDGVVIAVPPRATFEVLERVAETGRPCLAEKPVATSKASILLLEHLARTSSPVVAPFNRRYQPHVRHARAVLEAGKVGRVTNIEAMWRGPYRDRFASGSGTYRASACSREGVLLDSGTHALDAISLLLNGIADTRVGPVVLRCNPRGAEVEAEVSFTAGSIRVILRMTDVPQGPSCGGWRIQVRGADGQLALDEQGCAVADQHGRRRFTMAVDEMTRPVSDIHRIRHGGDALGTRLADVVDLSGLATAIYDSVSASRMPWRRPRGKALGRLNGAC